MTDPEPGRYRLQVTDPAARALAGRMPEKIAKAVYEFITPFSSTTGIAWANGCFCHPSRALGRPDEAPIASSTRLTKTTAS